MTRYDVTKVLDVDSSLKCGRKEPAKRGKYGGEQGDDEQVELHRHGPERKLSIVNCVRGRIVHLQGNSFIHDGLKYESPIRYWCHRNTG